VVAVVVEMVKVVVVVTVVVHGAPVNVVVEEGVA
jgi:hypothetical protein